MKTQELVSSYIQIPEDIDSIDFDTYMIDESYILKNIAGHIFKTILREIDLDVNHSIIATFICLVNDKYNPNPFHNFQHAVNVLHMTALLLKQTNVLHRLKKHILFGLLIAALCHDVDHPGHTNSYEINTFGKYAKLYNDQSVLENHHCTTTFDLLERSELIRCFKGEEFREFRKVIISSILGTDISKHASVMKEFAEFDSSTIYFDAEEQYTVCKMLLHSADLSCSVKCFDVYFEWSKRIAKELYEQRVKEQSEDNAYNTLTVSINEIQFITTICIPLWELVASTFDNMDYMIQRCKDNLEKWRDLRATLSSEIFLV